MPYRICKQIAVETGHMLAKPDSPRAFPHAHVRKVRFVLEAEELGERDMVCEFGGISGAVDEAIRSFDHSLCMNTDDPDYPAFKSRYGDRVIGFDHTDPTTEVVAKTIFDLAKARIMLHGRNPERNFQLRDTVRLVSVRVWENDDSWAEFSEKVR